jgi:hypothetical protein
VKKLLARDNVEADSRDVFSQTPLFLAASFQHGVANRLVPY